MSFLFANKKIPYGIYDAFFALFSPHLRIASIFSGLVLVMVVAASVQIPSVKENGEAYMENYEFAKGETILVPADMPDFYLVPRDRSTVLLEAVTRPEDELDDYIDPDTEAFLDDEDYEGLEDGAFEDDEPKAPAGASPLNFLS